LLKRGLCSSFRIRFVFLVRSLQDGPALAEYKLALHESPAQLVLSETHLVCPKIRVLVIPYACPDNNIRILSGGKAADRRDATSAADRFPEAATDSRDVVEEPQYIEQVRLAGSVRSHEEHARLEQDIDAGEVAPVLQLKSCKPQGRASLSSVPRHLMA
jgi:hypothetical protein